MGAHIPPPPAGYATDKNNLRDVNGSIGKSRDDIVLLCLTFNDNFLINIFHKSLPIRRLEVD